MLFNGLIQYICTFIACQNVQVPPLLINMIPRLLPEGTELTTQEVSTQRRTFSRSLSGYFMPPPPKVLIEEGWLEGYYQTTSGGRTIVAFTGIPYALPPTGERRFNEPVPYPPWKGVRDAKSESSVCLQIDYSEFYRIHGNEDCLHLDIYTPQLPNGNDSTLLPVMVFIHGGGYMSGSKSHYGPSYLLNNDVVLVTINYRLGVLGFLSSDDSAASGNWGLKDQLLALKWVNKNIGAFGGNSSQITIFGSSAGAALVGLHITSISSAGLFNKAICQSGSALTNWAIVNDTMENSLKLALDLNCPIGNSTRMISCMRSKHPGWIVANSLASWEIFTMSRITFGPVIENNDYPHAFMTQSPEVAYAKGEVNKVPLITGINKDEGGLFAASIYLTPTQLRQMNRNWSQFVPYALTFEKRTDNPAKVAQLIKKFYLGSSQNKASFTNRREWMQMFGDRLILQGVYLAMQYHSKFAPTYAYNFAYQDKISCLKEMGLKTSDWGVSHQDETIYLFNSTILFPSSKFSQSDQNMSNFVTKLWSNFVSSGVPYISENDVFKWEPVKDPQEIKVLELTKHSKMTEMPFKERIQFWQSLDLKDDWKFPM